MLGTWPTSWKPYAFPHPDTEGPGRVCAQGVAGPWTVSRILDCTHVSGPQVHWRSSWPWGEMTVWARSAASTWGGLWFGWPRAGTCWSPRAGKPWNSLHPDGGSGRQVPPPPGDQISWQMVPTWQMPKGKSSFLGVRCQWSTDQKHNL